MALEGTGGCKLTELVTNHILDNVYRNVLLAVVNGDGVTHEIRDDRGARDQVLRTFFSFFSFIAQMRVKSFSST